MTWSEITREKWKKELEAIAMPMLDDYSVARADVPEWFVKDIPVAHDEIRWE